MATNAREPTLEEYRLIAEGSHDWESWLGPDESLRWTSRTGVPICGYSAAECHAMARFPWPLVFKDDQVTFELFDHFVGERRPGNDLPIRLVRKDGSVIWVTVSWRPLHDRDGSYQGVRLSIHDRSWTLHNRYLDHFRPVAVDLLEDLMPAARAGDMQRVYRLLTERASRTLGVARVGVWLFDEKADTLVAADRFSSTDHQHLQGAVLSLANCPRYKAALTGDQLVIAPDALNNPITSELAQEYLRPLGIASVLNAPIVRGGRTIGVLCHEHLGHMRAWCETELAFVESLSHFLTLALYANEGTQLSERNRMLASIVEALPDPVVTVGVDGNPVYLNEAAYRTHVSEHTGLQEFKVQNIADAYSAEALRFRAEVIVPAALEYGYWRGEVRLKTIQGTEIPAWQTMVAHRDGAGELRLLTSILRDLREQKAVETRLRESEAKLTALNLQLQAELTALGASIIQDLETPLQSIDPHSLPEPLRTLIQTLTGSAARMRSRLDGFAR